MESLRKEFREKRDELMEFVIANMKEFDTGGAEEVDVRQFVAGHVAVIEDTLAGRAEARETFFRGAVKGMRESLPLSVVVEGMLRSSVAIVAFFASNKDHAAWLINYSGLYASGLIRAWEES